MKLRCPEERCWILCAGSTGRCSRSNMSTAHCSIHKSNVCLLSQQKILSSTTAPSETRSSFSEQPAFHRTGLCWWQPWKWKMNTRLPRNPHNHYTVLKCDSLNAVDPFILLLCGRGRDPVKSVVSLDDAAVCLRLTGLDHLIFVVGDEELKAVLGESRTWVMGCSWLEGISGLPDNRTFKIGLICGEKLQMRLFKVVMCNLSQCLMIGI